MAYKGAFHPHQLLDDELRWRGEPARSGGRMTA
jgi:hypothetical protein